MLENYQEILDQMNVLSEQAYTIDDGFAFQNFGQSLLGDEVDGELNANFSDINSTEFQHITTQLEVLYNDNKRDPNWRLLAARYIFLMHVAAGPTDLPIDDPRMAGCIKWSHQMIDFDQQTLLIFQLKCEQLEWLAHVYQNQAMQQLPKEELDSRHSDIQCAIECLEKRAQLALSSEFSTYNQISSALGIVIGTCQQYLPKNATIEDKDTQLLLRAFQRSIQFYSNVPQNKRTFLIIKQSQKEIEQGIIDPLCSTEIWKEDERWNSQKERIMAICGIGKLFAQTPIIAGGQPDYKQAARWLFPVRNAHDTEYAMMDDIFNLPEIQKEFKELETETVKISPLSLQRRNSPAKEQALTTVPELELSICSRIMSFIRNFKV